MELTPEMLKALQVLVRASNNTVQRGVRSKDITMGKEMVKVPVRSFNRLQSALNDVKDVFSMQRDSLNLITKDGLRAEE